MGQSRVAMTVSPIQGQPLRYEVSSRSNPEHVHYCDWMQDPPTCSCPAYAYNARRHMQNTGQPYLCAHLMAAKEHEWANYVETAREMMLSQ